MIIPGKLEIQPLSLDGGIIAIDANLWVMLKW